MATLYSVEYTKVLTGPTPSNLAARGAYTGEVSCLIGTYEASGTTAGDVVQIGKLNAGDRVIGFDLAFDDLGTGNTIDIGDTETANRYADGIDTASAAGRSSAIRVDGMNYVIGTATADDVIILTLADAACTGTIKVVVYYVKS